MYDGKDLTTGATIVSNKIKMSSIGQLQVGTIGRPGLLGLWILSKKYAKF